MGSAWRIGWGQAFWGAFLVLVFTLLWGLVGGALIFLGVGIVLGASSSAGLVSAFVLFAIGGLIIVFGLAASIIKVSADFALRKAADRVVVTGGSPPPGDRSAR